MENKNEAPNSLSASKNSISEDFYEKTKNNQDKDKSDIKSIRTQTDEEQNQDEVPYLINISQKKY